MESRAFVIVCEIWLVTFGAPDDVDAFSSCDSGLNICWTVGAWNNYVLK